MSGNYEKLFILTDGYDQLAYCFVEETEDECSDVSDNIVVRPLCGLLR